MTTTQVLNSIRDAHRDCCIIDNCRDHGCSVNLTGISPESLVIIHGERHRQKHGDPGLKIADRIIFANLPNFLATVIELKGGNSIRRRDIRDAVEQVQMGVRVVERLLPARQIANLTPTLFLAYSGSMSRRDSTYLKDNRITFRGSRIPLVRVNCGASLVDILARN